MAELESSTADQKVPCRLPVLIVAETPVGVKLTSVRIFNTPVLAVRATLGASYTLACVASPKPATNPIPVTDTVAPPVTALGSLVLIVVSLPVTLTGADPETVGLPDVDVVALPEAVTTDVPVTVKDPRLEVIALPGGKAVLPIDTATVPTVASSSGSLAATIVNCESPDIEKVPIDDVELTPVTNTDVPGVFVETVNPAAVIVGLTEMFTVGEPVAVDPCTPVRA